MNHGCEILKALRAEMARLGRKPTDPESEAVINDYIELHALKLKKKRKPGMPKIRKRDEIFDLLAKLDGQDLTQLTKHGAARIGEAKSQILDVMPDMETAVVLEEIQLRWDRWCRKHFDRKTQTVMALVSNWGQLGGGPKTKAEKLDIYQEPGNWHGAAVELYGKGTADEMVARGWPDIRALFGLEILRKLAERSG